MNEGEFPPGYLKELVSFFLLPIQYNENMKQIHLGIIGYGIQGSHYVKILCDEKRCSDIQVTAVFEIDENKRKQGMIDHPELSFFDDFEAMAKSGPR